MASSLIAAKGRVGDAYSSVSDKLSDGLDGPRGFSLGMFGSVKVFHPDKGIGWICWAKAETYFSIKAR